MKSSVKPILSLSLAAALAFGLSACSKDVTPAPTPSPTNTTTVSPSQTSAPQPTIAPTVTPSETSGTPAVEKQELKQAQEAFPDIKVNDGENKEEIQLAVFGANRYINSIYNSGYLANSSWVKNGADSQELVKMFGKDWSDDYRASLESLIADYHSSDEEVKTKAQNELLLHFFYYDASQLSAPADCDDNSITALSCLVNGSVESGTEMTYQFNPTTGHVIVNANFTANVRLVKNGVNGVTPVKYNVQLDMMKNPYPDEKNLRYAYIVNDVGGEWKNDAWHEGEK